MFAFFLYNFRLSLKSSLSSLLVAIDPASAIVVLDERLASSDSACVTVALQLQLDSALSEVEVLRQEVESYSKQVASKHSAVCILRQELNATAVQREELQIRNQELRNDLTKVNLFPLPSSSCHFPPLPFPPLSSPLLPVFSLPSIPFFLYFLPLPSLPSLIPPHLPSSPPLLSIPPPPVLSLILPPFPPPLPSLALTLALSHVLRSLCLHVSQ